MIARLKDANETPLGGAPKAFAFTGRHLIKIKA
jgi:hypothetical protein